jgi:hypothetical protein
MATDVKCPADAPPVVVNTTTRTGLKVRARLDGATTRATKVTDKELAAVPITKHSFHGDWNYTIVPQTTAAVIYFRPPTVSEGSFCSRF